MADLLWTSICSAEETLDIEIIVGAVSGKRRRGRPRRRWIYNTEDWVGLVINTAAERAGDRHQ